MVNEKQKCVLLSRNEWMYGYSLRERVKDDLSVFFHNVFIARKFYWKYSSANMLMWFREEREEYLQKPSIDELLDVLFCNHILAAHYGRSMPLDFVKNEHIRMITIDEVRRWNKKQRNRRRYVINPVVQTGLFNTYVVSLNF